MSSSEFLPGEWYLMVDCRYCYARYALFHDLTRGKMQLRATYCWTCPDCNRKDDYEADQLERYQHPTGLSSDRDLAAGENRIAGADFRENEKMNCGS